MPQVDLETLVSVCGGGSDRKIACETLADDGDQQTKEPDLQETPPDFPPDSFWLSKDAEFDWFDRNAFYERKESTKGNSNSTNLNPNPNPNSNSSSQRFSMNLKSKASIIGLPKTQKSCFTDAKHRRPANIHLFPKRRVETDKSGGPVTEPSSPKVSCMGRVRSKRDKKRRLKSLRRPSEPTTPKSKQENHRKSGLWTSLRSMFRSKRSHEPAVETGQIQREWPPRNSATTRASFETDDLSVESPPRKSLTAKSRDGWATEPAADPPGLGGMTRFASGRRSESWSVDESVDVDAIKSELLDHDTVLRR